MQNCIAGQKFYSVQINVAAPNYICTNFKRFAVAGLRLFLRCTLQKYRHFSAQAGHP